MIKKRPFILLEVLIALGLVVLCAVPLVVRPIRAYRLEMSSFDEVEGERLADWTLSQIKERLLRHEISWEKLPGLNCITGPFSLEPEMIYIPGRAPKKIERSFTLFGKGEKRGCHGEIYRMIYIRVQFKPELSKKKKKENIYTYRIAVQLRPVDESSSQR